MCKSYYKGKYGKGICDMARKPNSKKTIDISAITNKDFTTFKTLKNQLWSISPDEKKDSSSASHGWF